MLLKQDNIMKNIRQCLPLLLLVTLLSACQTHFSSGDLKVKLANDANMVSLNERLADGRHLQKVDNILFLVDDSADLLQRQHGVLPRNLLFALLGGMQRVIPNIKLAQGVRIFGPNANEADFNNSLLYGMAHTGKPRFKPVLINNTPANTMFNQTAMALDAAYQEMRDMPGRTAIIIFSSFNGLDPQSLLTTSAEIHDFYKKRVSLYPVFLSSSARRHPDIAYLKQIAVNGFASQANDLRDLEKLTDFMEKVLFSIKKPAPVLTATRKEPPLSHKKLVKEKELRVQLQTQFAFNKVVIKPIYKAKLQRVADFMLKYPDTSTVLEGYTCSMGPARYNMKLSARRAQVVKDFLVRAGVAARRLVVKAYGETRPIADNATEAGREKNRRVVAVVRTIAQGEK
jgi:outer membrane protein OmpA-like peptidoglycan-associated protein